MTRKLYQLWPGRNRFCCSGKCITGPASDWMANFCYYICALAIMIPYYVFLASPLWYTVTPALPVLTTLSVVLSLVFFLLTGFTDPGIIPRKAFLQKQKQKFQHFLMPDIRNENGEDKRRFCETCLIFRPPRASHCAVCQNCVEVFDHHCPFVNNCVAKRNYRYFLGFLITVISSLGMAMLSLILFLVKRQGGEISQTVIIVISAVLAGLIGLPLVIFMVFHIVIAIRGQTTREVIKRQDNEGPKNNWCETDPILVDYTEEVGEQEVTEIQGMLGGVRAVPFGVSSDGQTMQAGGYQERLPGV